MSRRRLVHGTAARVLVPYVVQTTKGTKTYYVAARGNVDEWRADRSIEPRGISLRRDQDLARKLNEPLPSRHKRGGSR